MVPNKRKYTLEYITKECVHYALTHSEHPFTKDKRNRFVIKAFDITHNRDVVLTAAINRVCGMVCIMEVRPWMPTIHLQFKYFDQYEYFPEFTMGEHLDTISEVLKDSHRIEAIKSTLGGSWLENGGF